MKVAIFGVLFITLICIENAISESKHWALLAAGSNGWYNYRHQADVCHAYQVLHNHGIPDEQIVVMMYDDIAYNKKNPNPGVVINHPNGSDVYHGVPKDYVGNTVTPENFLSVLKGDKVAVSDIGSGKVIDSGPDDHIFVNMVDHGGPGLFAFPSSELYAPDFLAVINAMNKANKFKEMVIYLESCESGSMFKHLPKNINVFATSAANGHESSWACYKDTKLGTYLGDVYSVKWMEDSDKEKLNVETLEKQYKIVKQETNTSHVCEFGDMDISDNPVDEFQGDGSRTLRFRAKPLPSAPLNAVPSEDVTTTILKHSGDLHELREVLLEHKTIQCQMAKIANMCSNGNHQTYNYLYGSSDLHNYNCYKPAASKYLRTCRTDLRGKDGFHLRQLKVLVNMCQNNMAPDAIMYAIDRVCGPESNHYCA